MKAKTFKEEGFPAMRVMAEMIFSAYEELGMSKLIEYEMHSNKLNLENQIHLCIFNKDVFPSFVKDKLEKVFQRFKQVNSLKHRANEGSGIGLSLVKSLVDAHEGEVYVKSKENEVTEFIIKLPNKTIINKDYIQNEVRNI